MRTQPLFGLTLATTIVAIPVLGHAQQAPQQAAPVIEEVIVTGTYIRRQSQLDSPSPLVTVGYEDMEDLGVNEISDIIERMTINTGSQNAPDAFTQNFTTGTTNINLRGLGVSSTLVMLNSRRQVQSAIATNRARTSSPRLVVISQRWVSSSQRMPVTSVWKSAFS